MPKLASPTSFQPKSAQQYYDAGKALCQGGNHEAALIELQEAATRLPTSAAVHFWVGMAQAGLQKTGDAVASFQQSARLDPVNAKPHLEMGRVYFASDQLGAATVAFRQAERLAPTSAEPHREMAAVLVRQIQFDTALEKLQRALALERDSAMTYVLLGRVYELKGMAHESDQAYREAERLDYHIYALAQVANGRQLEEAGQIDAAIKQYHAATCTDPNLLDAFIRLGGANLGKNYVTAAADAFRAATHVDPSSYIAHYFLGLILFQTSQATLKTLLFKVKTAPSDEAIRSLRRAVTLKPDETSAHLVLGKAYEASGVHHLAREEFNRVLEITTIGDDADSAREALRSL